MINESVPVSGQRLSYVNKIILAPMVRIGTLPMRLLALRYGADIVYTEELVDFKILRSMRMVNDVLNTVDFVDPSDGSVVFRTSPLEKERLVLQMGTACPKRALRVAKMIEKDVAAIDINMGCPKEFSIKGGMGAALLSDPERAKSILRTLIDNVRVPVTCKIRIFPKLEDTVKLVKEFEALGIAAIAIHGRTRDERPQHPVHPDVIRAVAKEISIPVIANGGSREICRHNDILKFREECGAQSVMIARAAEWNVSIFRKDCMLPLDEVITEYLKLCVDFDNSAHNTKYCVQNMLRELQETPRGKIFLESQTLEQICQIWDLGEYCRRKQLEYQQKGMFSRREASTIIQEGPETKKVKLDPDIAERNVAFVRGNYKETNDLPKSILHLHANRNGLNLPTYETSREEKLFRSVISYQGKRYTSSFWEKNKKFAEQGAALVCLLKLGLMDEKTLTENGSILE
ncbi:tRNA-dihydrouridine(20) synthase [NAD(P)+]-like [Phlebotomus argentipes]|uniref:tRNA-dihydrouridine(20) synthase [NAD(P)+]-like n=1 Tax=Phlebotomus argentipes TaxID=94469 RepID=UPI002892E4B0|nr:tRNA-dihydrouridine(20) synthase [NAD(P)+]-like [Phlebotomus argentipes]